MKKDGHDYLAQKSVMLGQNVDAASNRFPIDENESVSCAPFLLRFHHHH